MGKYSHVVTLLRKNPMEVVASGNVNDLSLEIVDFKIVNVDTGKKADISPQELGDIQDYFLSGYLEFRVNERRWNRK